MPILNRASWCRTLALALVAASAAACEINLAVDPVGATTVELTPDRLTVAVGDTAVIRSSVERANVGGRFDLLSLDTRVATVNQFGVVRGVQPGTTQVVGTWSGRTLVADTTEVVVVARQ